MDLQDRELCQLAEANGRATAEQDSRLEGLWGAIDEVARKQRHEHKKVSGLQQEMEEVRHQTSQSEETMEQPIGTLTPTALGLAEAKDRTSRVKSDVASLRAVMEDGTEKVADLKTQFWD
jgi:septation ring formation regulator EzrA